MGRMKEMYMELLHANNGNLPSEATIADLERMQDLKIFEWKEYEREQEQTRFKLNESENTREAAKIEQIQKNIEKSLRKPGTGKKNK